MISIKLDVNKIDKNRLFKGKQGTYLDAVLIETPNNQYGDDYMIVQSVSKEEREQGIKGAILGNAKIFAKQTMTPNDELRETQGYDQADNEGDMDLPF